MNPVHNTSANAIVKKEEHDMLNQDNGISDHSNTANEGVANNDANMDEGVYEVEAIVGSRKRKLSKGKQQYLIKWKGYPEEENTWEDVENVQADDLIEDYWREHNAAQSTKKRESKLKRRRNDIDNLARHDLDEFNEVKQSMKKSKDDKKDKDGTPIIVDNYQKDTTGGIDFNVDWEEYVNKVETVERTVNKSLLVYLKWNNGLQTVHHASQVRERCPLKLLDFYEAHLRFTKIDVDAE